jgi:hypothetical protein
MKKEKTTPEQFTIRFLGFSLTCTNPGNKTILIVVLILAFFMIVLLFFKWDPVPAPGHSETIKSMSEAFHPSSHH